MQLLAKTIAKVKACYASAMRHDGTEWKLETMREIETEAMNGRNSLLLNSSSCCCCCVNFHFDIYSGRRENASINDPYTYYMHKYLLHLVCLGLCVSYVYIYSRSAPIDLSLSPRPFIFIRASIDRLKPCIRKCSTYVECLVQKFI